MVHFSSSAYLFALLNGQEQRFSHFLVLAGVSQLGTRLSSNGRLHAAYDRQALSQGSRNRTPFPLHSAVFATPASLHEQGLRIRTGMSARGLGAPKVRHFEAVLDRRPFSQRHAALPLEAEMTGTRRQESNHMHRGATPLVVDARDRWLAAFGKTYDADHLTVDKRSTHPYRRLIEMRQQVSQTARSTKRLWLLRKKRVGKISTRSRLEASRTLTGAPYEATTCHYQHSPSPSLQRMSH